MSSEKDSAGAAQFGLAARVESLRQALEQVPPELLAERTGTRYQPLGLGRGEFHLGLFDAAVLVTYPGLEGIDSSDDSLPLPTQAVLAYYFHTSDGTSLTGEWVSFADLPDGRTYNQAFQGYSGDVLVKVFGRDLNAFRAACEKCGGMEAYLGDASFLFYALPRMPLQITFWCGDEEFSSNCKILFDRAAPHYLPTDVCAIVGSMLTRCLVRAGGARI